MLKPERKELIVVGGATASGKTRLAIELAQQHGTEIISADSRQFYREMKIGNARPEPEELAMIPHHFIADRSIHDPLSAGQFEREALYLLRQLFLRKNTVILVGGSGLYLRALYEGMDEFPEVSQESIARVASITPDELRSELRRLDPDYAAKVDLRNLRRLERALKVCYTSGKPYSSFLDKREAREFDVRLLTTSVDRKVLYDRINQRVDNMVERGLKEEAKSLYEFRHLPVLQTVGYQEWWPYFGGEYDEARAVELIKRNSRRYAKRQGTWFRGAGFISMPLTSIQQLDLNGYHTYEDYRGWEFPERMELLRGKAYELSPSPNRRHQTILGKIYVDLYNGIGTSGCQIFSAPFDVRLPIPNKSGKPDTVVQPDICVVCDLAKLDKQGCNGAPDLVVEIVSPGNPPREMREKYELYEEAGVKEYWLVQPAHATVFAYVRNEEGKFQGLAPRTLDDHLTSVVFPDLSIDLKKVFEYVGE